MLNEIGYGSRALREGMDEPLVYWDSALAHYTPSVMLQPGNLAETFNALVGIDESHSETTVAAFVYRSAIAMGWDGDKMAAALDELMEQGGGA